MHYSIVNREDKSGHRMQERARVCSHVGTNVRQCPLPFTFYRILETLLPRTSNCQTGCAWTSGEWVVFFINNGPLIDGIDASQFRQSLPMPRVRAISSGPDFRSIGFRNS